MTRLFPAVTLHQCLYLSKMIKKFLLLNYSKRKEVLAVRRTQAQSSAICRKKLPGLRTQKEVLARALFLGCTVGYTLCGVPVDSVVSKSMMFSKVIVDITIFSRSFLFSQFRFLPVSPIQAGKDSESRKY